MLGLERTIGIWDIPAQELCKSQVGALKQAGLRDSQRTTRGILRIIGLPLHSKRRLCIRCCSSHHICHLDAPDFPQMFLKKAKILFYTCLQTLPSEESQDSLRSLCSCSMEKGKWKRGNCSFGSEWSRLKSCPVLCWHLPGWELFLSQTLKCFSLWCTLCLGDFPYTLQNPTWYSYPSGYLCIR